MDEGHVRCVWSVGGVLHECIVSIFVEPKISLARALT